MSSNLCKSKCVVRIGASNIEVTQEQIDLGVFQSDQLSYYDITKNQLAIPSDFNSPVSKAERNYGEEDFYKSVTDINKFFVDRKDDIDRDTYPLLSERTNFIFTPVEIALFIDDFKYTPTDLSNQSKVGNNILLDQFEAFYTKDFSLSGMGAFCGLMPNIFGAINGFFNLAEDVNNLVNQFRNFDLSTALRTELNLLKTNIKKVIDGVIKKVQAQVQNIKLIIEDFDTFVNTTIRSKFEELKSEAEAFFEGISIENLKKRIDGVIDYASNLFKNPTLEEIQFLMYRFCGFVSKIESALNTVVAPLSNLKDNYERAVYALAVTSAFNTRNAVSRGARRLTPEQKAAARNQAKSVRPTTRMTHNQDTPGAQEYDGKPIGEYGVFSARDLERGYAFKFNNGKGIPGKIEFTGGALARGLKDVEDSWPSWMPIEVKVGIILTQEVFGKKILITSAYRSPQVNEALRARGRGAAKNSQHKYAKALDIKWDGFKPSEVEDFVAIAKYFGFRGIGRYNTFVHVDIGPARSWGRNPGGSGNEGKRKLSEWIEAKAIAEAALEAFGGAG